MSSNMLTADERAEIISHYSISNQDTIRLAAAAIIKEAERTAFRAAKEVILDHTVWKGMTISTNTANHILLYLSNALDDYEKEHYADPQKSPKL